MKKLLLLLPAILLAVLTGAQTIVTQPVSATNYCPGTSLNVDFVASGTFTAGNIFNSQLSDATGSFSAPVTIGAFPGTASGTIPSTIPAGTPNGLNYRIRVVSTIPNVNGTDNGSDISIGSQAASGTITGPTAVCAGATGNVYTVAVAPGATSYTWTLPAGWGGTSTTNTITTTAGASGGNILVVANGSCAASTAQTLAVSIKTPPVTPGAITGSNSVCVGSANTFSVPLDPNADTYNWTIPSGWSGTSTTNSISLTAGANPGTLTVTASNTCGVSAGSSKTIAVNPAVVPTAFITTPASGTICGTLPVTFTAFVNNQGSAPGYQWKMNGVNVGTPSLTYTAPSSANGDIVTFELTSSATCALPATVTSNAITLTVAPGVIASSTPTIVCRGATLQLSATAIPNATYSWSGPGYNSNQQSPRIQTIFESGYYTVVASSSFCTTRDSVEIVVNPIPTINVTEDAGTLMATPGFVSYQWALDGVPIMGATSANYTPTEAGNYVVRATATTGCTGSSALFVYSPTGIGYTLNEQGVSVYPNPVYNQLHVKQDQTNTAIATIYNGVGQVVFTQNGIARSQDASLDLNNIPAGVYVITLRDQANGNILANRTFVKQ